MDYPLVAQGWFGSFFHEWGDTASVLGFALGLLSLSVSAIGFFLTLRGQRKIREAAESATRRAAYQVAVAEVSTLLRYLDGTREAIRHKIWLSAITRAAEARLVAVSLATNGSLTPQEEGDMFRLEGKLRVVIQYIEQRLLPTGQSSGVLAAHHRRELDQALRLVAQLRGRLQRLLTET